MEMSRISEMVEKTIEKYQGNKDMLIQILIDLQGIFGWLPEEVLREVSRCLETPITRVYEIATFYKLFSLAPKGKHLIRVCMGTSCKVRDAPIILDRIRSLLGIEPGETTSDFRFSLETVKCIGCSAIGPVIAVDRDYYGKVKQDELEKILSGYK